jgi:uncharacterized spore protein YtfJ
LSKPPKRRTVDRLLDRVTGARLCYGEPVQAGETTVIPVSRVRAYGGLGYGSGRNESDSGEGEGGGGGGFLDAQPLGYIEVRPEGTRYVAIPDPERARRLLRAGAAAVATVAAGRKLLSR